jgi:cytochrome c5
MTRTALLLCATLTALPALAQPSAQTARPSQTTPAARTTSSAASTNSAEDGQRVFQQNCARCHNSPEGFPPSITVTVARHMRVRANLSEKQYQALLTFFNP